MDTSTTVHQRKTAFPDVMGTSRQPTCKLSTCVAAYVPEADSEQKAVSLGHRA